MVQMHLIYHFTSSEDGMTYYEANTHSAYYLIRAGKILELIENRLGIYAAKVMSSILYLGHAQVSYLETLPEFQPEGVVQPQSNGVNGDHHPGYQEDMGMEEDPDNGGSHSLLSNGEHTSEAFHDQLHSTLKMLAAHGYITRVRDHQFHSQTDNLIDAQRTVKSTMSESTLKGKKLEAEMQALAQKLVDERTDGDLSRGLVFHGIPRGGKRRHVNGVANVSNKRPRLESPLEDMEEEEEDSDEDGYHDIIMDGDDDVPMNVSLPPCI
jgi:DNA-directed RNA polymerase III subunit RPC3